MRLVPTAPLTPHPMGTVVEDLAGEVHVLLLWCVDQEGALGYQTRARAGEVGWVYHDSIRKVIGKVAR